MKTVALAVMVFGCCAIVAALVLLVRFRQMATSANPGIYPDIMFVAQDLMKPSVQNGPVNPAVVASRVQTRLLGIGAAGVIALLAAFSLEAEPVKRR